MRFFFGRYQDVHNQFYIMVMASGRWLGVRLDLLASILIGAVSLVAVLVSQDAGRFICKVNQNSTRKTMLILRDYASLIAPSLDSVCFLFHILLCRDLRRLQFSLI